MSSAGPMFTMRAGFISVVALLASACGANSPAPVAVKPRPAAELVRPCEVVAAADLDVATDTDLSLLLVRAVRLGHACAAKHKALSEWATGDPP